MADLMDLLIRAAEEQGFTVRQTKGGTWVLDRGDSYHMLGASPDDMAGWLELIRKAREIGVKFPGDD